MSTVPPEEALTLEGPVGVLEARLRGVPAGVPVRRGAVLCHPHPQYGGSMDNKVLYRIAKRLAAETGTESLRFNFRGTGHSEGSHDGGRGEVLDALAAMEWWSARRPGRPIVAIGFSFGAAVGLRAGATDPRVEHLVGLGLPLELEWELAYLATTTKPRLFVQGEHDRFGDAARLRSFAHRLTGAVAVRIIPGADHLFTGREDEAVEAVVRHVQDLNA